MSGQVKLMLASRFAQIISVLRMVNDGVKLLCVTGTSLSYFPAFATKTHVRAQGSAFSFKFLHGFSCADTHIAWKLHHVVSICSTSSPLAL